MAVTDEALLTGDEIAAIYRISPGSVRRWARDGLLKVAAITPGGQRRYRRRDVEELLRPKPDQ
jgi:excisionase family DNA binding protein